MSTPKVKKSSDVKFSKSAQTETDKRYLAASKEETKKAAEADVKKSSQQSKHYDYSKSFSEQIDDLKDNARKRRYILLAKKQSHRTGEE